MLGYISKDGQVCASDGLATEGQHTERFGQHTLEGSTSSLSKEQTDDWNESIVEDKNTVVESYFIPENSILMNLANLLTESEKVSIKVRDLYVTIPDDHKAVPPRGIVSIIEVLKNLSNNSGLSINFPHTDVRSIILISKKSNLEFRLSFSSHDIYELYLRMIDKESLEILSKEISLITASPFDGLPTIKMPALAQKSGKDNPSSSMDDNLTPLSEVDTRLQSDEQGLQPEILSTSLTGTSTNKGREQDYLNDSEIVVASNMALNTSGIDGILDINPFANLDEDRINTSTPTKQISLCEPSSISEYLVNESELSDRMNLKGASRMAELIRLIAGVFIDMRGIIEELSIPLLGQKIKDIREYLKDFLSVVEELINERSKNRLQDKSEENHEACLQQIYDLKSKLKIEERINSSIDQKNQQLTEKKLQLAKDNQDFLGKCKELGNLLCDKHKELEEQCSTQQSLKERLGTLLAENKHLKEEIDGMNKFYKHLPERTEEKSGATKIGKISKSREVTQSNNGYHKEVKIEQELRQKIDEMQRKIGELLSENSMLLEELRSKCEQVGDAVESLSTEISSFRSEQNLYNELEAVKRREELDNSDQAEMYLKNGDLVNVTQGYSKKADNPTKLTEQFKAVKSQLLMASTYSRKQMTYASVSLVLSGAFSVGASLTMFNLAICISLTVAALTFLAVWCYCSYKASTALSNIEVDQIGNCVNLRLQELR
ncbi:MULTISPECIES: TomO hydrophobic C-terminal domain-containing protein [unclassified Wolbachia]|uniref:TomO hydrophobic C-terminal domain-containing protein n=1 Tax=unclassified Wolbachia TaxID=2640676 RepID=UPI0022313FAF|nr:MULTISPECIES: hypothetical protein [unclassified Wolbachia]